jgi:general secretion pathway protein D
MKMKSSVHSRAFVAMLLVFCLLVMPLTALAGKKGEKNFKRGMQYESAQQWDKAAQEYTLAVAADPANMDYQLHYRRALFNASQMFMLQGRALAEQKDFVGAYNAFRQAYGYDPVNQLALSEMDRMLRLQEEKTGGGGSSRNSSGGDTGTGVHVSNTSYGQDNGSATPPSPNMGRTAQEPITTGGRSEQLRVINYSGDLKSFIRSLSDQLSLNVIFDRQSFAQPRNIDINMHDVTTAQALDYIFLQEGLFFQKLSRRTILVADQSRRAQYQQLVIRTFYLSNTDPTEARNVIQAAIPPSQGRPQIIVIPDKATNSLTVRDTAENVRLIGEILQSIDKDRAEVVMDVNIYEVSRTDIFQLGNQIGDANGVITLGGSSPLAANLGSGQVANQLFKTTTALGAAIIIPQTSLTAFQRKDNTKLIASTQIHAFTGEESTARIGQRVPVQTAQTYPFGAQTSGTTTAPGTNFNFPTGGFPVINYEPTGLTLKFTPQVFPNLDVQVKMSIESKDVQNPGSATPSFTERTITGTARIQNNRTMMLASVAQDKQSSGRGGLPLLGLIPVLGRLFSTPRRDNLQTDIVIAVTPRVLRAPAVTPRDEELRPSGTLSSPTIGTLEAMIQETDREDQLAEARRIPKNVQVQLPDATEQASYVPAPKAMMSNSAETPAANTNAGNNNALSTGNSNASAANNVAASNASNTIAANATAQQPVPASMQPALTNISTAVGPSPTRVLSDALKAAGNSNTTPQPIDTAATTKPAALSAPVAPADDVPPPSMVKTTEASVVKAGPGTSVELRLMPERATMLVGERQRVALSVATNEPLGTAVVKLHFDPRVIAVRGVSQGLLLSGASANAAPTLMQSIDPSGALLISVQTPTGTPLKTGMNIMLFVEVEAIAGGESEIVFDKDLARLETFDGRTMPLLFVPGRIAVK